MCRRLLLLSTLFIAAASANDLYHRLGSGFTEAGSLEGSLEKGDAVLVRQALSSAASEELQNLAEKDQFYTVRVGPHATASVRASCFAAPPDSVHERLSLTVLSGQVVGLSYVVTSPTCGQPLSGGSKVTLPVRNIPVKVNTPQPGFPLVGERTIPGQLNTGSQGSTGSSTQRTGGSGSGAATSRPMGVMPNTGGQAGAGAQQQGQGGDGQPAQEKSWLERNWMFVAGGVMVVLNMATAAGRNAAQQGGAAPAGAGAARR